MDWRLWPWIIAANADDTGYALAMYRLERDVARTQGVIAAALYPVVRALAKSLERL